MNDIAVLQPFHDGWAEQQRLLLDQIRPLTMEQMQLRPAPGEYAIWQLASNMAGGRLYWLCFMLGEDDQGLSQMFRVDHVTRPGVSLDWAGWEDNEDRPRSAVEIEDAFHKTWNVIESCLERWTPADLVTARTKRNAWGNLVTLAPAEAMWKLMTHEAHHGAEISAILRVHGLPTTLNW